MSNGTEGFWTITVPAQRPSPPMRPASLVGMLSSLDKELLQRDCQQPDAARDTSGSRDPRDQAASRNDLFCNTKIAMPAIISTFITPPTNSNAMRAQQQP